MRPQSSKPLGQVFAHSRLLPSPSPFPIVLRRFAANYRALGSTGEAQCCAHCVTCAARVKANLAAPQEEATNRNKDRAHEELELADHTGMQECGTGIGRIVEDTHGLA